MVITIKYIDFEYDSQNLSDFGFVICDFNGSSDEETVSAGSVITFNRVSRHNSRQYGLTSTNYDECLEFVFDICKNECEDSEGLVITDGEFRMLMRWLNRRRFLKLRFIDEEIGEENSTNEGDGDNIVSSACFYNASFNIEKITIGGELYGLRLTTSTDKPFGYGERITESHTFSNSNEEYVISDMSDEIGAFTPDVKITCASSGTLQISNSTLQSVMVIDNCTSGEVINIYGDTLIIETSKASHRICDDFNFEFLKIGNSYSNRENVISASAPCSIEISYNPIIKNTP